MSFRSLAVALILLSPVIGGAQVVDERPVSDAILGPAAGSRDNLSVTTDGVNFLAAWNDGRSGTSNEIYAARFTAGGKLLDRNGIRIPDAGGFPIATFAGDAYAIFSTTTSVLSVVRISRDGEIIDGPRVVPDRLGSVFPQYVGASNGKRIVLAARDHLLLLDDHADLVERAALPVSTNAIFSNTIFVIGCNGSSFVLAWGEIVMGHPATRILALDALGHPSGPVRTVPNIFPGRIGSDGHDYMLVTSPAAGQSTVMAMAISAAGEPSSPQPLAVPANWGVFGVAWDGNRYQLAVAHATSGLSTIELRGTDGDSPPTVLAEEANFGEGTAAAAAGHVAVVFVRSEVNGPEMHAVVSDAPGSDTLLSQSAPAQSDPMIASDGTGTLVVWSEISGSYVNFFSADGTRRYVSGVRLGPALFVPKAALFDGTNYVVVGVVYENHGSGAKLGTFATRIAPDGTVLDPNGVYIADGFAIGAGRDSAGTVIITQADYPSALYAMRIDRDLAVTRRPVRIVQLTFGGADHATIASAGDASLIAYEHFVPTDLPIPAPSPSKVEAVRISTNLDPLDGAPIQIDDRLIRLPHAHAVSDGTSFVVFWTDDFRRNIFAQRVGRDGTLQGPRALVSHGLLNDVVWDGHAYALAVADTSAAYVTHLGADLQPRGDTSFITAYAPIVEASLAPERSGLLAIYLRRAFDELSGGVYRAFIRTPVPAPARARSAGR